MKGIRKRVTLLILSSFLLWQVAALTHFALVPHGATGLHLNSCNKTGTDSHDRDGQEPAQGDTEEGCAFLVALTKEQAEPVAGQVVVMAVVSAPEEAFSRLADAFHNNRELYRLSPSLSPPSIC